MKEEKALALIKTPAKPEKELKQAYRHELKYIIGEAQTELISRRLRATMDLDPNAGKDREYMIRSLYFDDFFETAVSQKLAGDEIRKKYRLRIYNMSDELIKLECKEKIGPYIRKRSLSIDKETCDALLYGNARKITKLGHSLADELFEKIISQGLHPVVLVEYAREAYIAPYQDVRITLDKRIHTGLWDCNLFDANVPMLPAMLEGENVIEVKFNRYLPEYFRYLIQGEFAQRSAASKYVLCRRFE